MDIEQQFQDAKDRLNAYIDRLDQLKEYSWTAIMYFRVSSIYYPFTRLEQKDIVNEAILKYRERNGLSTTIYTNRIKQ